MKIERFLFNAVKRTQLGLPTALHSLWKLLFVFLFASQLSSAFASNYNKEILYGKEGSTLLLSASLNSQIAPLHLPFESTPVHQDIESLDEDEQEDFDTEHDFSLGLNAVVQVVNLSIVVAEFAPINFSIRNQVSVPFFILYHSWKSYIS
jgi:hypothetical protein